MGKIKPRLEFTIGADSRTHLHFKVVVWKTYAQLQSARRKIRDPGEVVFAVDGFCHRYHNRHVNNRCLGLIHFCADKLTVQTIAHEALHAAVGYAEWIRPADDSGSDDSRDLVARNDTVDECLAYSTGYMTEGIIFCLRKNKLRVKPL